MFGMDGSKYMYKSIVIFIMPIPHYTGGFLGENNYNRREN